MNNLSVFKNEEFGEVRTVTIDGEPYFVGKDVAEILGYSNTRDALSKLVDDEDKLDGVAIRDSIGREQTPVFINESGLFSLILRSQLPSARRFKRWVTAEVLPSIRKHGGYISGQDELSDEEFFARALEVARRINARHEQRIANLEVENQILLPKAEYFDELVDRNTLTNFRDTAKALGIKPKAFVRFLIDHNYIYRDQKGNLMPRSNEKAEGLFEVKQCQNTKTKWAGVQTLITPRGVETFRLLCADL